MAEYTKTLEEELAEQGIVGSYIWKPNSLFAKKGNKEPNSEMTKNATI